MDWLRRAARSRLVDLAAVVIAALGVARIAAVLPGRARAYDFAHYYVSSRLALDRRDPYVATLEPDLERSGFEVEPAAQSLKTVNTPAFVWAFAPLAMLPADIAYWVWVAIQAGCLALILLCGKAAGLSSRGWRLACAVAVASAPVFWNFYFGQMQLLLGALLALALAQHLKQRHTMACVLVTVAGLLKIFPFLLLPWFVWRGGGGARNILKPLSLSAALAVAVVCATGADWWLEAFQNQRVLAAGFLADRIFNYTLPAFVVNAGGVGLPAVAAGIGLIGAAYWFCVTRPGGSRVEFALLSAAMVAGIPYALGHYFVLLILPMTIAATLARATAGRLAWLAIVFLLLNNLGNVNFMLTESWLQGRGWLKLTMNFVPLYGVLVLGAFLVTQSEPEARQS